MRRRRALAVLVVAVLAGCGSGDVFALEVGDCFQRDAAGEAEVSDVETVDCAEPHDNEVFHIFELEDGDFPDDEEVLAAIEEGCLGDAFEAYVGTDYRDSEIELYPLTPTQESWREGDREIVCAGYVPEEQVEGSFRGSGR